MRVAFFCDRKRSAQLHRLHTQRLQPGNVIVAVDAPCRDQRDAPLDAHGFEELQHQGHRHLKIKTRVLDIRNAGSAQMPARQTRVLQDDGVGQTPFFLPLLHHQLHAARVRQNGNQGHVRETGGQFRQVQRQTGPHHQRLRATFQRLTNMVGVAADRLHHVHRHNALAIGQGQRLFDLAVQSHQIGGVDGVARVRLFVQVPGLRHQVRVQPPQIHRRQGPHRTQSRHGSRQPPRRYTHSHTALQHRQ